MSELAVTPVSSPSDRKRFLGFPWTLYQGDPHWVPPLLADQVQLLGYRPHPFYERNEIQTFLATRGGQVCGRIAAVLHRDHNEYHGEKRGFWGFFECVDDPEVAGRLFDAVKTWHAERGIHALRGPTNPSLKHTLGLLIEGFDSPPTFMMTYNPPYYERLVEGYGFRKVQDLYAYWDNMEMVPRLVENHMPIVERLLRHRKVKIRTLDKTRFMEDIKKFLWVFNQSLANTWGFVPLSDVEAEHAARSLRHLMVPELAIGAEVDGRLIGAAFGLPDYNARIKAIDGRLYPFGFLRLTLGKQKIKKVRILSANVLPEYQRMGMGLAMLISMLPYAQRFGVNEVEYSWVLESNRLSRGALEKAGAKLVKTYRLYDLEG
jgi:GNAT superfamily N-acetyltransferase